jgi:hypothetical protein
MYCTHQLRFGPGFLYLGGLPVGLRASLEKGTENQIPLWFSHCYPQRTEQNVFAKKYEAHSYEIRAAGACLSTKDCDAVHWNHMHSKADPVKPQSQIPTPQLESYNFHSIDYPLKRAGSTILKPTFLGLISVCTSIWLKYCNTKSIILSGCIFIL